MFEIGLTLLAHRGRQVGITSPTGRRANFDLVDFSHNESRLFGLDTLKRDLVASARILEKVAERFATGAYQPHQINQILPLEEAQQAYERVSKGHGGLGRPEYDANPIRPNRVGSRDECYATNEVTIRGVGISRLVWTVMPAHCKFGNRTDAGTCPAWSSAGSESSASRPVPRGAGLEFPRRSKSQNGYPGSLQVCALGR